MKTNFAKLIGFAAIGMAGMSLFIRRAVNLGPGQPPPFVPPEQSGPTLDPRRQAVIDIALGELGPQDPDKYWSGVQPRLEGSGASWCGGFALWVLQRAGITQIPWETGKGFCFRLHTVRSPLPGDIAYFSKNQHHAIVQAVSNGQVHTIDGNQPGETVRQRSRPLSDVAAFYSINSLLQGDLA